MNTFPPMLPALASEIASRFPELDGRAFAVAEVDPFSDQSNKPTLPVAVVALADEQGEQGRNGGKISLVDTVVVHFMFEPVKYQKDGNDTPFFMFYNYEPIRDQLLTLTKSWRSPRNGGMSYKSMTVTCDEFAVYMTFTFTISEAWCPTEIAEPAFTVDGIPQRIVQPTSKCCEPEEEATDPCDFPSAHE